MTLTVWSRASAASRSREVEYKLGLRDRMAIFTVRTGLGGRRDCTATAGEAAVGIDHESAADRRPPQQHAEPHLVAPCQREIDAEPLACDRERRAYDRTSFYFPVARPDIPDVHQRRLHPHRERLVVL